MEYKRRGERLVLRLDLGEKVGECLLEADRKEDIRLAEIPGLGVAPLVELGMFDTETEGSTEVCYQGTYEIASITDSVTKLDGEPYLHVHMVIGNLDRGKYHGGYTIRAVISAIAEVFVNIMSSQVERKMNEEIGLYLFDL